HAPGAAERCQRPREQRAEGRESAIRVPARTPCSDAVTPSRDGKASRPALCGPAVSAGLRLPGRRYFLNWNSALCVVPSFSVSVAVRQMVAHRVGDRLPRGRVEELPLVEDGLAGL